MGLMIGDDRACAGAVTDMLLEAAKPKGKYADRQVSDVRHAWIFGHYDSRGGGALVLADNVLEAYKKYVKAFFSCDVDHPEAGDDAEYVNGLLGAAEEDFIKKVTLVVCDAELPEDGTDLDVGFNDDGYLYGKVESRYKRHDGKWEQWQDTTTFVMWKPKKGEDGTLDLDALEDGRDGDPEVINAPKLTPPQSILKEEFRLVREELGEDACGLCLIR